jgi:hypothetical protein
MRFSVRLVGLAAVLLAGSACTSNSTVTNPPPAGSGATVIPKAGSTATSGAGGTSGSGGTAGTGGTSGAGGAVTPVNQCNNPHDMSFQTANSDMVRLISGKCASGMIMGPSGENCSKYVGTPHAPAAVQCFDDCVKPAMISMLGDTLSDACLACPNAVVQCATKYCVAQCLMNPVDPKCTACLCQQRADLIAPGTPGACLPDVFAQCAGFPVTADQAGCNQISGAAGGGAGSAGSAGAAGSAGSAGTAGHAGSSGGGGSAGHSGSGGSAGHAGSAGR